MRSKPTTRLGPASRSSWKTLAVRSVKSFHQRTSSAGGMGLVETFLVITPRELWRSLPGQACQKNKTHPRKLDFGVSQIRCEFCFGWLLRLHAATGED
jgi:hypothetical protein